MADHPPGSVLKNGYRLLFVDGRRVYEHRHVWEQANGPVPDGYQVHHINHDKLDNRLENLALVDVVTHRRLHNGYLRKGGRWFKSCPGCRQIKEVTAEHWHFTPEGWPKNGKCRPCWAKRSKMARKRAKRRRSSDSR